MLQRQLQIRNSQENIARLQENALLLQDQLIEQLVAYQIFEETENVTLAPLVPFIRRLELSLLDFMTIRDLIEISDCRGDLPLMVVLMAMFAGEAYRILNVSPTLPRSPTS